MILISVLRELTKLMRKLLLDHHLKCMKINQKTKLKGEIVLVLSSNIQIHYSKEMILNLISQNISKFPTKELALLISNKTDYQKSIYNKIIKYKS